jgi:hypothetical protein
LTDEETAVRAGAGLGIAICLGTLLLGCTTTGPDPSAADDPDGADVASPDEVAPEPPDASDDDPGPAVRPCDAEVIAAIDATIAGQLEAFAADDFEAAIGFASRSFRTGVDVDSFRALILEAYPTLTDDAVHRSGGCLITAEDVAEVRIEVTGDGGARDDHVYRMVAEGDRWLVDAAVTPDGSDRTVT